MCWPILVETSLMLSFVRTVRDEARGQLRRVTQNLFVRHLGVRDSTFRRRYLAFE